jgi:NTE family protein
MSKSIARPTLLAGLVWALAVTALPQCAGAQPSSQGAITAAGVPAQPSPQASPAARPKIGLALGGGSARGMAHVGVLEWFEQHHIPIDYIAGTSMGGLIAGAYASGMTPAEIRELMRSTDWDLMFVADSPFKYKTFRRKEDRRAYPSQFEFGLKDGFSLPEGLNPGQQVSMLLDGVALPYYGISDFDQLPTPFRCVATDLKAAESVVLERGPQSQALRATMAIPGVFTPVNYGSWLLVDGGVLNNIPADVVKQMGADIVIAVNVGADPVEEEKTRQSLFTLLGRTIDTMMTTGTRTALKSADLVLDPDLKGLDSMSWRKSDELADRGYQAAEQSAASLGKLEVDASEHAALLAARAAKRKTTIPAPTFVEVTGVEGAQETFIRDGFESLIGKPFDRKAIERAILNVGGTDRYEYLSYRPMERDGQVGLQVHAQPKTYGPPFLNLGLDLNNIDASNFAVNLRGRVTAYDWAGAGSEVRIDGALGTEQSVFGEIYRPLGKSKLFVAPRGYYTRYPVNGYMDDRLVAEYRFTKAGGGVDVGYGSGRRAELRLGVDLADVKGRISVGLPDFPEVDGTQKFARLRFAWDGQTSPLVPTRGLHQIAELRYYWGAPEASTVGSVDSIQEFWQGEILGTWFKRVRNGKDRLFAVYGAGSSFGKDPTFENFVLGGPFMLGAFNNDELRGTNYLLGDVGYMWQVGRLPDVLGQNVFLTTYLEQGSAFNAWDAAEYDMSVSFGAVLETLIGPIFAAVSTNFDGRTRFYVALGPLFPTEQSKRNY